MLDTGGTEIVRIHPGLQCAHTQRRKTRPPTITIGNLSVHEPANLEFN